MSNKNITKKLCIFLIGALLVVLLCMCSGCIIRVNAPKTHSNQPTNKTVLIIFSEFTPIDTPEEIKPIINTKPIVTLQSAVAIEPPKTAAITESIEPIEPETRYYDIPLDEDLQDYIFELCEKHGIDPALVFAMIKKESSFKVKAVGDNGNSLGLMQIQPRWHRERMDRLNCPDLLDPYQNVTVGIDILSDLLAKDKPIEWVLMAYNGGKAYANRNLKAGTISYYAKKVLEFQDNFEFKD